IAMPEVGIGFFPDVGACFLLARSPGCLGTYLAMTGDRIGAADALHCGLADIHIPSDRLTELPGVLAACRADEVRSALKRLSAASTPARLAQQRPWIDSCFGADQVEAIVERLSASAANAALAALQTMHKASPTSLKVALRNIRSAAAFTRVEEGFQQDYRI